MPILPDKFLKGQKWKKNWAGQWDIFVCFFSGRDYTTLIKKQLGVNFDKCLFVYKNGFVDCYLNERCLNNLGKEINKRASRDISWIDSNCKELKKKTEELLKYYKKIKSQIITEEMVNKMISSLSNCYVNYVSNTLSFDYLSEEVLRKKKNVMEKARIFSEPVYTVYRAFIKQWANQLEKELKIPSNLLLCFTPQEMKNFYATGKLPNKKELQSRFNFNVILSQNGNNLLITGEKAKRIEKKILSSFGNDKVIKGVCAYPGRVTGKVKVVLDPAKVSKFNKGDILVTPMTRPEYLGLVKKSAGLVTDAGGMLSHAAITARELKKPCIVGTEVATKKLKDGDRVEVDSSSGVIKILK